MPATAPIITALNGETVAQGLVMATSPAKAPFRLIPASGFPNIIQEVNIASTAAVAADRFVLTNINAMSFEAAVVEPGLKPNHPSQRINTPSAAKGMLCPRMGFIFPSFPYFPKRGPRTMVPAKAAQPPTEWTTVEPAKSMKPRFSSQPFPLKRLPQAQLPNMG